MLCFDGSVKLIDFGIAKLSSERALDLTGQGEIKGKLAYMAPEQLEPGRTIDARVDLYAVGVMLHELLSGRRLFRANTDEELIRRVRRGEIEPPSRSNPDVSAALDEVCLRALARDPADRFADGVEMARALADATAGAAWDRAQAGRFLCDRYGSPLAGSVDSWLPTQVGRPRTVSASRRRYRLRVAAIEASDGARHRARRRLPRARVRLPRDAAAATAARRRARAAGRSAGRAAAVAGVRRRSRRAPAARRADGGAVFAGGAPPAAPRHRQANARRGSRSRAATSSIRSADPRRCARSSVTTRDTSRARRAQAGATPGARRGTRLAMQPRTPLGGVDRDVQTLFVPLRVRGPRRRDLVGLRRPRRQHRLEQRRRGAPARRRLFVCASVAGRPAQRRLQLRRSLLQPRRVEEPERRRGQRAPRRRRRRRVQLGIDGGPRARRLQRRRQRRRRRRQPGRRRRRPRRTPHLLQHRLRRVAGPTGRARRVHGRRRLGHRPRARRRLRRLLGHQAAVRRRQDRVGLAGLRVVGRPIGTRAPSCARSRTTSPSPAAPATSTRPRPSTSASGTRRPAAAPATARKRS